MYKKTILFSVTILFAVSCHRVVDVQKRRYRSGYSVLVAHRKPDVPVIYSRSTVQKFQKAIPKSQVPSAHLRDSVDAVIREVAYSLKSPARKRADNRDCRTQESERRGMPSVRTKKANGTITSINKISDQSVYSDAWFLGMASMFAVVCMAGFFPLVKRTTKGAVWARKNPKEARAALVGAKLALAGTGVYLGHTLYEQGVLSTEATTLALAASGSMALLFYPMKSKNQGILRSAYFRKKLFTLLIGISGFLLTVNAGNRLSADPASSPLVKYCTSAQHSAGSPQKDSPMVSQAPERSSMEVFINILASLAILALAFGILFLTVVLSCELSCSGQEGAATLVLLGGIALALFVSVFLLMLLWKPRGEAGKRNGI